MFNEFKKGMVRGIGTLIIVGGGLFAFQVTGTIKTWTTGETLTAADLNTTIQSLKNGIEQAALPGQISISGAIASDPFFLPLLETKNVGHTSAPAIPANRSGTIKSVRVDVITQCSANVIITLRKNASGTDIQLTVPANTTATVTDADTVAYVAGDILNWQVSGQSNCASSFSGYLSFQY